MEAQQSMASMDFWLDEITKAADQEFAPIIERWSRLKPWSTLPAVQREQLAETISKQAADILVGSDQKGRAEQLFDLAQGIAPVSARVLLLQGVALYKKSQSSLEPTDLLSAKMALEKALVLLPGFEEARFWLAQCDLLAYEKQGDIAYLQDARVHLFDRAPMSLTPTTLSCSNDISLQDASIQLPWVSLVAKWHWLWADHFQEPSDYRQAIEAVKKALAVKYDCNLEFFLALSMIRLVGALGQESVINELVKCLNNILAHELSFEQWQQLSLACHQLCSTWGHRSLLRACRDLWTKTYQLSPSELSQDLFEKYAAVCLILMELEPSALGLREFETLIRKRPESTPEAAAMAFLWKSHARLSWFEHAEKPAQVKQLLRHLEEHLAKGAAEPHYWMLRGSCYLVLGEYFKDALFINEAIEKFQKGLGIDSDRPGLWMQMARAFLSLGELSGEIELSKRAVSIFPLAIACGRYDWRFWMDWGLALFRMADATGERSFLSEAVARFEKAFELVRRDEQKLDAHLLYLYGAALDFLGDLSREDVHYERAIEMLQAAVEIDPSHSQAPLSLAVALTHAGEAFSKKDLLEKANSIFESLAQLDHEDEYLWNEWAVCVLSLCRIEIDEGNERPRELLSRAIVMLNKALCLGNQHAIYNLCCAHALALDPVRALDYLEKAFDTGIHPPIEDMGEDEWLDDLRPMERFQRLIEESKKNESDDEPEDTEDPEDPEEPGKGPGQGNLTSS